MRPQKWWSRDLSQWSEDISDNSLMTGSESE